MKPTEILLVEDNPADVRVATEVLALAEIDHRLHVVGDGVEALEYLRGQDHRFDLLLVDLTLPRRDGRWVLAELQRDEQLRAIPVVVFSTSDAPEDIRDAYALSADYYLTKPTSFADFTTVAVTLATWWRSRRAPGRDT